MKFINEWKEIERRESRIGKIGVTYEMEGYYIRVADADYLPGKVSISASPINCKDYLPEVYIDCRHNMDKQDIEIQTTSWGALPISEIDKVMEAYKKAQTVAHEIMRAFPECF